MDSEKVMKSFRIKKDTSFDYLWDNCFFCHFVNNFSALLLCKIYPGKNFGLKLIPKQSDLFRYTFELIRVRKKFSITFDAN